MKKNIKALKKKIEELENTIFFLEMIDHWTSKDNELHNKYNEELRQLKSIVIEELTQ